MHQWCCVSLSLVHHHTILVSEMEESIGAIESGIDPLPADPSQTCWLCANKWREQRKNSLHPSLSLYLAIFLCLEKTWGQNYAVWCVSPSCFAFRPLSSTRVGQNSDLKHRLTYNSWVWMWTELALTYRVLKWSLCWNDRKRNFVFETKLNISIRN